MIRLSGRMRSAMIIGGQGIRARKMRTFLSMLSLFLGVLAVVAVQAGSEIAKRALLTEAELTEGRDGTVQFLVMPRPGVRDVLLRTLQGRSDGVVTMNTPVIVGEPGVTPVNPGGAPFDDGGGFGYAGPDGGQYTVCDERGICTSRPDENRDAPPRGQAIELSLSALTGDIRRFRPFRVEAGSWLDFTSAPSLAPRIVLNKQAAKGFTRYRVPAEMRLLDAGSDVANATPRVVGVVDDGMYEPTAYVRTDELLNWFPVEKIADTGTRTLLAPGTDDLQRTLRARLVAVGSRPDQMHARTIDSRKQLDTELSLMRWIFLGMASLVLLIGVAGILNVGLATVGERIEEFALRRAVGTPRSLLAGIVLAENLLTGLLTATAAIGAGMLGLRVISALFGDRPALQDLAFPWQAGVAGVLAGLAAGLLGGFVPALRASRIPIATVMRA